MLSLRIEKEKYADFSRYYEIIFPSYFLTSAAIVNLAYNILSRHLLFGHLYNLYALTITVRLFSPFISLPFDDTLIIASRSGLVFLYN